MYPIKRKAIDILMGCRQPNQIDLPKEIEIPDDLSDVEDVSDYITDSTGFCHKGFRIVSDEQHDKA